MIANSYSAHGSYPHKLYEAVYLDAGSSGCTDRINNFAAATGTFTFARGNCLQSLSLFCMPRYKEV
eukprot:m.47702 g.47702  ORF g.47702 m.47702 type:complete len:66 (+) comp13240_c0_seq10:747-944(+)